MFQNFMQLSLGIAAAPSIYFFVNSVLIDLAPNVWQLNLRFLQSQSNILEVEASRPGHRTVHPLEQLLMQLLYWEGL